MRSLPARSELGEIEYEIVIGSVVTILLHRFCFAIWGSEVNGQL
jgi:hypothetical protein